MMKTVHHLRLNQTIQLSGIHGTACERVDRSANAHFKLIIVSVSKRVIALSVESRIVLFG